MSFITTKFREILLSSFRGVALTNCFSSFFHFGQISKFKKGVAPWKNWVKFPVEMHIYRVCPSQPQSFTKFCALRGVVLTIYFSSIFHFGNISKFKKGVIPRETIKSKFLGDMHIYMACPSQLQRFRKFSWPVSEELRWQEKQDWLTNWLTDWQTDWLTAWLTDWLTYWRTG